MVNPRINSLFSIFFCLFLSVGLWNAALGETIFESWKQIIVCIAYLCCFNLAKNDRFLIAILSSLCMMQAFLILSSILFGVSVKISLFNIFFYATWLPFFIWSATGGGQFYLKNYSNFIVILILISAIGLIVDLKTDYFNFLNIREEIIDNFYLEKRTVAKRSAFMFTTSTLVMPVLAGMIVIALTYYDSLYRILICLLAIIIAIITTAAVNSVLISGFIIIGFWFDHIKKIKQTNFSHIVYLMVFIYGCYLSGLWISEDEILQRQFKRVFDNQYLDSNANIGRIEMWNQAINDISHFSIQEYLIGAGLGSTNGNLDNKTLYGHGESSFLQAYIEAGMIGIMLKLAPFILGLFFTVRRSSKNKFLLISYFLGIFISVTVAPIFGNIPSQAVLGFLVGLAYVSPYYST
jgi:hypothetical protein